MAPQDTSQSASSQAAVGRPVASGLPIRGLIEGGAPGNEDLAGARGIRSSGSGENSRGGFARNVSAPFLGSFPFSIFSLVQIPSAAQSTSGIQTPAQTAGWRGRAEGRAFDRSPGVEGVASEASRYPSGGNESHSRFGRGQDRADVVSTNASSRAVGAADEEAPVEILSVSFGSASNMAARTRPPTPAATTPVGRDGCLEMDRGSSRNRDCSSSPSGTDGVVSGSDRESSHDIRTDQRLSTDETASQNVGHGSAGEQKVGYVSPSVVRETGHATDTSSTKMGSYEQQHCSQDVEPPHRGNGHVVVGETVSYMLDDETSSTGGRLPFPATPPQR